VRLWTWAKRWFGITVVTALGGIWTPDESIQNRVFGTGIVFLAVAIVLAVASDGEDKVDRERRKRLERGGQISNHTIDGEYW
jgi:hypothetical protein